jgi:O-methyltransferase involved in polyketide biosynthesis
MLARVADDCSIADVTDTARWVAALRARETRRPDAVFQDLLAPRLAGERGVQIARSFPQAALVEWGVVVRTSAIDRIILEALQSDVDTVINLGAGMDTRPYRLALPPGLRWIEVDFPSLLDAKQAALRDAQPVCRVERVALDLLNRSARRDLFAACGAASRNTLVITEGLVPYLSNDAVRLLAEDLLEVAGDRGLPRSWQRRLRAAPVLFRTSDWFRFFDDCSWRARRVITSTEEADRLGRPYPCAFPSGLLMRMLPLEVRRRILSVSGAALLVRTR